MSLPQCLDVRGLSRYFMLGGLCMALTVGHGSDSALGAEQPAPLTTYRQAKDFIGQHTNVVELANDRGRAWPYVLSGRGAS